MQFWDVFKSPVAVTGMVALFLAQLFKVPFGYWRTKQVDWSLLLDSGGMPSSHSALISSITTAIGFYVGWGSPLFALAFALAIIVVYDATGVRRQAGLQAARINLIVHEIIETGKVPEQEWEKLRESIGHSPAEAFAGVLFGIAIAVVIRLLMPPA
ncbi:MAG: divergent PAP2 family protein [Chloroflexi bacterium]|jgi:acid phosphatase family membrane protein YuiD|nr:divergent PAP2 family protein [Anaerolineaceae bacterium]NLI44424.1 divergent PAP2 family protein [Chloroflexota bacterium]HOE34461.1 divergent PAP2 family protein [Anaerolineaceae bacterium]HOT25471.1 divergent PAP2 family protein [Anaerolineaceae bacterium]HQH57457.1 divergent PAP2 family protein [Anaerolineaceae bacterium]